MGVPTITKIALINPVAMDSATTSAFLYSAACDASSGVTHIDSDGDDQLIPGWFVVYSALLDATIVAHQGTNTKSL